MLCEYCGTDNADVAVCTKCGRRLQSEALAGQTKCRDHSQRVATDRCVLCHAPLCDDCRVVVANSTFCRDCVPTEEPTESEQIEFTPLTVRGQFRTASTLKRFASAFMDIFILALTAMIVGGVFWVFTGVPPLSGRLYHLDPKAFDLYGAIVILIVVAYYIGFTADEGQTPGKQMVHTAVVDSQGIPPSLTASIVRFLAATVSIAPLGAGFLYTIFDRKHRALHDILAGTTVISLDEVDEV